MPSQNILLYSLVCCFLGSISLLTCKSGGKHATTSHLDSVLLSDYVHQPMRSPQFEAADLLKLSRHYTEALQAFDQLLSQSSNLSGAGRGYCLNQAAYLCLTMNQREKARQYLAQYRQLTHNGHIPAGESADYWMNTGWLAYQYFQPDTAKVALERALGYYKEAYPQSVHVKIMQTQALLALVYRDFEKDERTLLQYIEQSYEMALQYPELKPYSLLTETGMVTAAAWNRRHDALRAHANNVINLAQSTPDTNYAAWAWGQCYLARLLRFEWRHLEKKPSAEPINDQIQRSLSIAKKAPGPHQIKLLTFQATFFGDQKKEAELHRTVEQIKELEVKYQAPVAFTDLILGRFYLDPDQKDTVSARYHLERLIHEHAADPLISEPDLDEAYLLLSSIYASQGRTDEALQHVGKLFTHDTPYYTQSLNKQQLLGAEVYSDSPYPFYTLNEIGKIYLQAAQGQRGNEQQESLQQALRAFSLCDSLMFAYNSAYSENNILIFQKDIGESLYRDAVRTLWQLDSLEGHSGRYAQQAVHFMDRMKSDVLYRYLPENNNTQAITDLKRQIDSLAAGSIKGTISPEGYYDLAAADYRLNKIKLTETSQYQTTQLTAKHIQAQLRADEAVLHYACYNDQTGFVLYCDQQQAILKPFGKEATLAAVQLDSMMKKPNSDLQQLSALSYTVYQALLAPFQHFLDKKNNWLILPDGVLSNIPFEALCTQPYYEAGSMPSYLVNHPTKPTIRYSSAWKIWASRRTFQGDKKKASALFCNYGDNKEGFVCSHKELKALRKVATTVALTEQDCQSKRFVSAWAAKAYDIVHLSLHGAANAENPSYNSLWFGPDLSDPLYSFQIAAMKGGKVDLLVLSACEGTRGQQFGGEGVYSVSRSFLQAGASSIIAALWKLDNCPNASLLELFYARMNEESNKSKAFSEAKRLYLSGVRGRFRHPYYWAGMVFVN